MRISQQQSRRGVKVFLGQEHVKTVPTRYKKVVQSKHILNPGWIRLTSEERFRLEVALFELELKKGARSEKLAYDLIKRSAPDHVRLVYPKDQPHYYLLVYKNGHSLRCSKRIYNLGRNTEPPLYRNF